MDRDIILHTGDCFTIRTEEGVRLFDLADEGAFVTLLDYTARAIVRFNKKAIPFLRTLQEEDKSSTT